MGSFIGHAVPGTFFLLFGIWYTIQTYRRYFRCIQKKTAFCASVSYSSVDYAVHRFPYDSAVKLICSVIGMVIECYSGLSQDGFPIRDRQHMTMYFFFGMSGLIDILTYKKVFLPEFTDFVAITMALSVELILFKFHIHGRSPIDIRVHQLLIIAIGANAASVILMAFHRSKILSALSANWSMTIHGSWFIHLGFILYNPIPGASKWKEDDDEELSLVAIYFMFHCFCAFLFMLFICLSFGYFNKRKQTNLPPDFHTDYHEIGVTE